MSSPSNKFGLWQAIARKTIPRVQTIKPLEVWKENRDEIRLLMTDLAMPDGMTGKNSLK